MRNPDSGLAVALGLSAIGVWIIGVLLSIGIPIAVVVVAIHFIHKLW